MPAPDVVAFERVTRPSITDDGLYAPGLRFGEPRVVALLASVVGFSHVLTGFRNRDVVARVSALLDDADYTTRQATYDLRRLRRKGLIVRVAGTHCYRLTELGRRIAVLFTKVYNRMLTQGLSLLDLQLPEQVVGTRALATAWRRFERALDTFLQNAMLAA